MKEKTEKNIDNSLLRLFCIDCMYPLFVFEGQSGKDMLDVVRTVNPYYLICGFGMMFLYNICEASNLFFVFRSLHQKVSFLKCMGFGFVEFYFSAITPSSLGGQPMQVYYMQKNNINVSVASLSVLIYILTYQFVLLGYFLFMFFFRYQLLISLGIYKIRWFLIYGATASLVMVSAVLLVLLSKSTAERIVLFFANLLVKLHILKQKEKMVHSIERQMDEYAACVRYLKTNMKLVIRLIFVMILQFTFFFSIPYFVYQAFGGTTYGLLDIIAVQSVIHISAASIPLPGAVGAAENNSFRMFQRLYPAQSVLPAMLLTRFINFYGFALISGLAVMIMQIGYRRKKKASL